MGVFEVKSQLFCFFFGGVCEGVIFNGGIRVGNFIDYGFVQEFFFCIEKCCSLQICDVVFMVENNCYFVKCVINMRCCFLVVVRMMKFKMFMVVKKIGYFFKFIILVGSNLICI